MKNMIKLQAGFIAVLALVFAGCGNPSNGGNGYSPSGDITWTLVQSGGVLGSDGIPTSSTTALIITFSSYVDPNNSPQINITGGPAYQDWDLQISNNGNVWTVPVTVNHSEYVSVSVIRWGIVPGPQAVMVYKEGEKPPIDWTAAANGTADVTTSTAITFTFTETVSGLDAQDITLDIGTGSAVKGQLTGSGKSWTLGVTVTNQGTVSVKIDKSGITAIAKDVTVYKMLENPVSGKSTFISPIDLLDDGKIVFSEAEGNNGTYTVYDFDWDYTLEVSDDVIQEGSYTWNPTARTITLTPAKIAVMDGPLGNRNETKNFLQTMVEAMIQEMIDAGVPQADAEAMMLADAVKTTPGVTSIAQAIDAMVDMAFTPQVYTHSFSADGESLFLWAELPPPSGVDQLGGKTFSYYDDGDYNDSYSYSFNSYNRTYSNPNWSGRVDSGTYSYNSAQKRLYVKPIRKNSLTAAGFYESLSHSGSDEKLVGTLWEFRAEYYNYSAPLQIFGYDLPDDSESPGQGLFVFTPINGGAAYEIKSHENFRIGGNVAIPENYRGKPVTSIAAYAFIYCWDLTSLTIPASITSIGNDAFPGGSNNFTSITVAPSNPNYASEAGILYNKTKTTLIKVPGGKSGHVSIPAGVTSIGDGAFSYCWEITSISIPAGVTSIGNGAFSDCSGLTSINIPASVMKIGGFAFSSCRNLTSISIPAGVTTIGDSAFSSCTSLTSINIPASVTTIGDSVFSSCDNLSSVTISAGITTISNGMFSHCLSLTSISIPAGVTSIGGSAFSDCRGLTSITIPASVTEIGGSAFSYCENLASVSFAAGSQLKTIAWAAFSQCSSLTSISIPAGVTSIGNEAFSQCSSLTSISIPSGVTSIGNGAFSYCDGLTSITIPASVTRIGDNAFSGCVNIASVSFAAGSQLETIGWAAFSDCSNLSGIIIPASVTGIDNSAFSECTSLASITLPFIGEALASVFGGDVPSSLKTVVITGGASIGWNAFRGGFNLTSITLPASVTEIGESAFSDCTSLVTVTCLAAAPPTLGQYAFQVWNEGGSIIIPALTAIKVPSGSVNAYKEDAYWSAYASLITAQ